MRTKAIRDLVQLPDQAFFEEVSRGLAIVLNHASKLFVAAERVASSDRTAGEILAAVAEEEAAKFLILVDAVRCPRSPSARFGKQLGRFNDHLAKGLYASAYSMAPGTLSDLRSYLDWYRSDFYLDGPNDVDWIFPNEIKYQREARFYVDYAAADDGNDWLDPRRYEEVISIDAYEPRALAVSKELSRAGITHPHALRIVAETWRGQDVWNLNWDQIVDLNAQTLEEIRKRDLLSDPGIPVDHWQFPLYDLDLTIIEVDRNALRQRQASEDSY